MDTRLVIAKNPKTTQGCEQAMLARASQLDNLLVFTASYHRFQFAPHVHEEYALGIMDRGAQSFRCKGRECTAPEGSLITLNPDILHDGRSADQQRFCYRILYLPAALVEDIGESVYGRRQAGFAFSAPVTKDPWLATGLSELLAAELARERAQDEALELLQQVVARLWLRHGEAGAREPETGTGVPASLVQARSYILDCAKDNIRLDDMAAVAGLSRYHFLRQFTSCFGLSPHNFLMQQRLKLACQALRQGRDIADAAYEAGFADQSHLSRRFKAAYGLTPRQFQQGCSSLRLPSSSNP